MSKRQVGKLNFKDNIRWRKNVNVKGIKVEDSNPSFFIDWSMKGWLGIILYVMGKIILKGQYNRRDYQFL